MIITERNDECLLHHDMHMTDTERMYLVCPQQLELRRVMLWLCTRVVEVGVEDALWGERLDTTVGITCACHGIG